MFRHSLKTRRAGHYAAASAAVALLGTLSLSAPRLLGTRTCTWVGPPNGSWSDPDNWDPAEYAPDNGAGGHTYDVLIDDDDTNAATAVLDMHCTIDSITVDADDQLTVSNGRTMTIAVGPVANEGLIVQGSSGNHTDFRIGGDIGFTGGGEFAMSDRAHNRIYGTVSSHRLLNGAFHTIRGSGQLGVNLMRLTNEGLIDADQTTELLVDLAVGDHFNTGTMQASGAGTLRLNGTALDNTGGVVRAVEDGVVNIQAAQVWGGTLDTQDAGVVRIYLDTTIQDLSNTGQIVLPNGNNAILSGIITNDAAITVASTGNTTDLKIGTAETTLTGPGALEMTDGPHNRIYGTVWSHRLLNDAAHTIRGSGQLGVNLMWLTNEGLIDADQTTELVVDLAVGDHFNTGTMQASGAGTLRLNGTALDNTGGVVRAVEDGVVNIQAAQVWGGTLDTQDAGVVRIYLDTTIQDLSNTGQIVLPNGNNAILSGVITNDAAITVASTGHTTDLKIGTAETTLTGPGALELTDGPHNRIYGTVWSHRLLNDRRNTIRGSGQLGVNLMWLTNEGLIDADQTTELVVDLSEGDHFNLGTMQASGAGTLRLQGTALDNTGGVVQAVEDGVVNIQGSHVWGGTLDTQGAGTVQVYQATTVQDLSNTGQIVLPNGNTAALSGTITNDAAITIASTGHTTDLKIGTAETTLTGSGAIDMTDSPHNRIYGSSSTHRLINEAAHTIRGSGQLGANLMSLTNRGAIVADLGSGLVIDPSGGGDFSNHGLLHVTGDGVMTIASGPFTTDGTVLIDEGRVLARNGNFTELDGITWVNGTLTVTSGVVDLQGGTLGGNGIVNGDVSNQGRVGPGAPVGELSVTGDYTQTIMGTLEIELAGTDAGAFDVLSIEGDAELNGSLDLVLVEPYEPRVGDEFTILTTTGGTVSGQLFLEDCDDVFRITYESDAVILTVVESMRTGDINCDGVVDFTDVLIVLASWGDCPEPPGACPGDVNDDGATTFGDILVILANWG